MAPYDAGKSVDPLDDDAGDWLDYEDEEPEPAPKPAVSAPPGAADGGPADAAVDAAPPATDAGGAP